MINGVTQASAAATGETAALGALDKDAFLKLLVAQLRFQNPLNPLDGQEYLAQAAQFATVERLEQLSRAQQEAIAYQQVLLSSSLVGRVVRGTPAEGGAPVEGVVEKVKFEAGVPTLVVDGIGLPIGAVEEVRDPAPDPPPDQPPAG